ncbi:hypothetical protein [Dactylosporangium sp. NPDC050588]|uniref:hypothetical protein n=1 Tax=Dactylosporangium sp. NPDC050588 TaxID=3157211 RepID=UPI0033C5886D
MYDYGVECGGFGVDTMADRCWRLLSPVVCVMGGAWVGDGVVEWDTVSAVVSVAT